MVKRLRCCKPWRRSTRTRRPWISRWWRPTSGLGNRPTRTAFWNNWRRGRTRQRSPVCCGPVSMPAANNTTRQRKCWPRAWRRCRPKCVPSCGVRWFKSPLAKAGGTRCEISSANFTRWSRRTWSWWYSLRNSPSRRETTRILEQWEKELRKLEGADGLFWQYYGALRLVAQASGPEDAKLAHASELQGRVQNQRPAWPKAYVLQGLLSEGRGSFDQAVEAYQEAIRLGEQQSMAYERLISLLTQLDRAAEAEHYLGLLQGQIAGSERLSELEIQVAAKQGQFGRALETARHGVQQRPQDPLAYLWLGQVLSAGGNAAEAENRAEESGRTGAPRRAHARRPIWFLCPHQAARSRPRDASGTRQEREADRWPAGVDSGPGVRGAGRPRESQGQLPPSREARGRRCAHATAVGRVSAADGHRPGQLRGRAGAPRRAPAKARFRRGAGGCWPSC